MFRTSSNFDKLLDKATSHLLLDADWPTILSICDLIRQNDVQPKYVMAAIKKKLYAQNPHGAMFALQVLESIVKNCGSGIHDEVANKVTCEMFHDLVKTTTHESVRQKVLELIQAWAFAFRNEPKYRAVQDVVNIMKAEGFQFPVLKEADAMFSADSAPDWSDGDVCDRCRVAFGLVQRKHHCRACGKVFCSQCSQHTAPIPKFGIEKEVRVCDACFEQLNRPATAVTTAPSTATKSNDDLPPEYVNSSLAQQNQTPPRKTEEELREEEELQLALALSQSEAEAKEKEKKRMTSNVGAKINSNRIHSPPPPDRSPSPHEEVGPELARYLNRSYWEQRQTNDEGQTSIDGRIASPSAPIQQMKSSAVLSPQKEQVDDPEMEDFVNALKSQVEIFVNRMKINSSRGRSIANDSSVQPLFMNITAMHSRLLRYIQQTDDERLRYEGLQDKLTQVKDARAALDALRDEHREKMRRVAEEAERQRQLQMAHKLEIMRKKKQEYLQYQRQLALQRIQEQEREMQMRQEQQKQQYFMGPQYPSMGPTYLGSPVHGANPAGAYPVSAAPPAQYQGYPQYTGGQMHMGAPSMIPPPPGAMMQGPPQQMQQMPPQAQSGMTLPNVNPQQQGPPGIPIAIMNMKPPQQMIPQGSTMQMGLQGPPQQLGPQGNPQQMGPQGPPQPMPPYPAQIGQQNSATGSRPPPGMQQSGSMSQGIQQLGPSQQNSQKDPNQANKSESETTEESPQNQTAELISFD